MGKELIAWMVKRVVDSGVELFLHESAANHYQPPPPPGFVALRSNKRRVFVQEGTSDEMAARLRAGEYHEEPLSPAWDEGSPPHNPHGLIDYTRIG